MKTSNTIRHYALPTRKLARLYTNLLKEKGYNTTQPRTKTGFSLTQAGVKTGGAYLVSTCTKIKKPCKKVVFNVIDGRAVKA